MVLPYIDMIPPRVYMSSQSWTPLPPPSPYHISGSSQCTSPKHPVSVSNLDWWYVSYMLVYMFQCHSPKSSHPFPLPQSPKVCSIHLCLLLCLLSDGSGRFSCHLWIQHTVGVQGRVISSHHSDALHSLWILTLRLNVYSDFVSWKIFNIFFPRFPPTSGVWFLFIAHSFIYGYAMQLVGS